MSGIIQVQTTADQQETVLTIARDLVERRLAACAQIGGPITSVYRWKDNMETAAEWTCTIKTTDELFSAVEQRIRETHPYEVPEIIAVEITNASLDYVNWLRAQLVSPNRSTSPT